MTDFETWWWNEGSALRSLPNEDAEAHVHRVCKIAWHNGALEAFEKTRDRFTHPPKDDTQ